MITIDVNITRRTLLRDTSRGHDVISTLHLTRGRWNDGMYVGGGANQST